MHYEELIQAIKSRRETLEVTQATLAKLSEVSPRTIKQFESGKGNPTLSTMQKILDVLGLELTIQLKEVPTES